jgi:hypothetical protein
MLRLLALIAALLALALPLFLPRSMRGAMKGAAQTKAPNGGRLGRGLGGTVFRLVSMVLAPLMPRLLAMLFNKLKKPTCNRCRKVVRAGDTTCSHCGNVLSEVRYTVHKAQA